MHWSISALQLMVNIMKKQIKLVICRALEHILSPLVNKQTEIVILDIALHVNPKTLRDRLNQEIAQIEKEDVDILLGYGLCGRALEGVSSQKSRLILPRVDDCVGAILGSRQNHQQMMSKYPGSYFLDPKWVDSELDIFVQAQKGIERIPVERRTDIIKMMLKHYSKIAFLGEKDENPEQFHRCQELAEKHDFNIICMPPDYSLLHRLINGPWTDEHFVIAHPGEKIPFF